MPLKVPTRQELLKSYKFAERLGRIWMLIDLVLIAVAIFYFKASAVKNNISEFLILIGASIGPTLLSVLYIFAKKRKLIEDLREDVRFGELNKSDLLEEVDQILQKMKIKKGEIKIFVTAEKMVNASALALGVGWLLPELRSVQLNKGALQALGRKELGTVIAHELAHIYRYPLNYQQSLFLHILTSSAIAVTVWSNGINLFLALMVIGIYFFCLNFTFGRFSTVVEHLCDDTGAEVVGIDAALRAEYLVSQHSEIVSSTLRAALKQKLSGQRISIKEINRIIEDSISFDTSKAHDLETEVLKRIDVKEKESSSSFYQFLKSIVFSDRIDAKRDLEKLLQSLEVAARIKTLPRPEGVNLDRDWFYQLIKLIKNSPEVPLFRVPEELVGYESTHPPPRVRIVYLWDNFIEVARN